MKTGIELIHEERIQQYTREKFSAAHDDMQTRHQLSTAALCYLRSAILLIKWEKVSPTRYAILKDKWPFHLCWWKPTTPIRDLVKAGALIAAEIDRLQRLEKKHENT